MNHVDKFSAYGREAVCSVMIFFLSVFFSLVNADESTEIVTFDFAIADTLGAFQRPPLAMAGLAHYRKLNQECLLPDSLELGLRFQPNFEYLDSLEPDAILISPPAHVYLEDRLSSIADVVKIQIFGEGFDLWESLGKLTKDVGALSKGQQQAQELIDYAEARLTVIATQIARPVDPLLVVEVRDDRHVRIYGHGSLEDAVLKKLGLENSWQGATNSWGFSTLSIREAFELEGQIVLLRPVYTQDLFNSKLPSSGLWQHWLNEASVVMNRNYWPWGGLPSALRFAEALADALAADGGRSYDFSATECLD